MKDSLGDRIKENYENRTRLCLPRRTYTIIRIDGKSFSNFTKGYERPYDARISSWMDYTALELCRNVQGCKLAYTQSDEISLLLTDFEGKVTEAWFDGNIQKITSVAASIATSAFNRAKLLYEFDKISEVYALEEDNLFTANFDARVFTIPDPTEVANYFIWRQQDAVRNSIQMLAQSLYSHKELQGKNGVVLQELCFQKGKNWNDVSVRNKRGGFVCRDWPQPSSEIPATRHQWMIKECPHFTTQTLEEFIPRIKNDK
jgi:tRNA(His) 5'-end guanylyltransferase